MGKRDFIAVVEGGTDAVSLRALKEMCAGTDVHFHVMSGDITTMGVGRTGIVAYLADKVAAYVSAGKIPAKGLVGVMHIMDTDGAFVPPERVLGNPGAPERGIDYREDCMLCRYPDKVRLRNGLKGNLMQRLAGQPALTLARYKVPYRCYYMSRNLEHVLHGESGVLTEREKAGLAKGFADRRLNPAELEALFMDPAVYVPGSYKETWEYIQVGTRSLERHSNMHLAFTFLRECGGVG